MSRAADENTNENEQKKNEKFGLLCSDETVL